MDSRLNNLLEALDLLPKIDKGIGQESHEDYSECTLEVNDVEEKFDRSFGSKHKVYENVQDIQANSASSETSKVFEEYVNIDDSYIQNNINAIQKAPDLLKDDKVQVVSKSKVVTECETKEEPQNNPYQHTSNSNNNVNNKELFILKMLDMGFLVDGKRLNTGGLFDFKYTDLSEVGINIDAILNSSFEFDDELSNESDEQVHTKDEELDNEVNERKGFFSKIFKKRER